MQRSEATRTTIDAYLRELGHQFPGEGTLYLVGGSMLVYQGLRPRTADLDYRIELSRGDEICQV